MTNSPVSTNLSGERGSADLTGLETGSAAGGAAGALFLASGFGAEAGRFPLQARSPKINKIVTAKCTKYHFFFNLKSLFQQGLKGLS
jgi:hypothetical protein